MDWLKERFHYIKDSAGIRLQVFSLIVAAAVGMADKIYAFISSLSQAESEGDDMIFGFPSWILSITIGIAFLFLWSLEYGVKLRKQILGGRKDIADLRKSGVELRNRGAKPEIIYDQKTLKLWIKETNQWKRDVIVAVGKVSMADAVWFETLDTLPDKPRIPFTPYRMEHEETGESIHHMAMREHDHRVKLLGEMIRDLWGKH